MYPIVYLIYGVPLTEAISRRIEEMEADPISAWFEDADGPCGFTEVYSGSAEHLVGYCGVELARHPAVQTPVDLSAQREPTGPERSTAMERIARLDPELTALLPPVGLHLVFGTS